jgi:hypothetical protein
VRAAACAAHNIEINHGKAYTIMKDYVRFFETGYL